MGRKTCQFYTAKYFRKTAVSHIPHFGDAGDVDASAGDAQAAHL
jgi:hypothetical protein